MTEQKKKPELPPPPAWDGKVKVLVGKPSDAPPPHINPVTEPQRRG